ncbi:glucoamylase family protein [Xanthomonas hyacinthi]|nr:glucoamylase family protein [Xanthomonas hyacinthi]
MLMRKRPAGQLDFVSKFKLLGSLSNHIADVALFFLSVTLCAVAEGGLLFCVAMGVAFGGIVFRTLRRLFKMAYLGRGFSHDFGWIGITNDVQLGILRFGTLPGRAISIFWGILTGAYRFLWSRQLLLEWRTFRQEQVRTHRDPPLALIAANGGGSIAAVLLCIWLQGNMWAAICVATIWIITPLRLFIMGLRRTESCAPDAELTAIAWTTWRCVRDMLRRSPMSLIADSIGDGHIDLRTSPTNIGMSLVSVVSAEGLGFISRKSALGLVLGILRSSNRLERRRGHLLNWYDASTGQAIAQNVSSVDCANFIASLTVIRAWLNKAMGEGGQILIARAGALLSNALVDDFQGDDAACLRTIGSIFARMATDPDIDSVQYVRAAERLILSSENEVVRDLSSVILEYVNAGSAASYESEKDEAIRLVNGLLECDLSDFCDVGSGLLKVSLLDGSHEASGALYDLLASESRLAVLLGVGRGDFDSAAWLRLGRAKVGGPPCLLSWSGSLFEHLMPEIFFGAPAGSLLEISCRNAIRAHQANGVGDVWGRAECGYGDSLEPSYGPHGERSIALGEAGPPVDSIASYASILAVGFEIEAAVRNMRELRRLGAYCSHGFYESVNFGASAGIGILRRHYAHHQGMIIAAISNFLSGVVVRLMEADDDMRAASILLCEVFPEEVEVCSSPE